MIVNYFNKYTDREEAILNYWIDNTGWINDVFLRYEDDHTPLHDWKISIKSDEKIITFTVQVKEEEPRWFSRTGNLGLDFISVFNFRAPQFKKEIQNNNYWVKPADIDNFLKNKITVQKWGKLKTCDSVIHIFFVQDILCQAYSNSKLQSKEMIEYLKSTYRLRVNKKQDYGLADNWESAAFFVKPSDKELKKCEVNNLGTLKKDLNLI